MDEDEIATTQLPGDFNPCSHLAKQPAPLEFIDAISDLGFVHQQWMKMRWGFDDGIRHSLEDVSEHFGCDLKAIKRIDSRTIRAMRRRGAKTF